MRIQHNIAAMNAYRNYNTNTSAVSKNLEKLSSGYKINRAGDDAAGLAISEKMRAQISGLEAASKNVKDGISLVKTAEGAMQEVQDMLNRMVTLATQSANGTYDNEVDRLNLQKEVDQLRSEINRIADSSNFNGIKLLDGSQEIKTSYTNLSSPSDVNGPMTIISDGQLGVDAQAGVFSYDLSQLEITIEADDEATQALDDGQSVSNSDWLAGSVATTAVSITFTNASGSTAELTKTTASTAIASGASVTVTIGTKSFTVTVASQGSSDGTKIAEASTAEKLLSAVQSAVNVQIGKLNASAAAAAGTTGYKEIGDVALAFGSDGKLATATTTVTQMTSRYTKGSSVTATVAASAVTIPSAIASALAKTSGSVGSIAGTISIKVGDETITVKVASASGTGVDAVVPATATAATALKAINDALKVKTDAINAANKAAGGDYEEISLTLDSTGKVTSTTTPVTDNAPPADKSSGKGTAEIMLGDKKITLNLKPGTYSGADLAKAIAEAINNPEESGSTGTPATESLIMALDTTGATTAASSGEDWDGTLAGAAVTASFNGSTLTITMDEPPQEPWDVDMTLKFHAGNGNGGEQFKPTVINEPVDNTVNRQYAQATIDLTKVDLKDGMSIQLGNTTYTFAIGSDSRFKNADNVVDLTDMTQKQFDSTEDDTKLAAIVRAANRLSKVAQANSTFYVGSDTKGGISLTEKEGAVDYSINNLAGKDGKGTYGMGDGTIDGDAITATDENVYKVDSTLNDWKGLVKIGQASTSGSGLTLQIGDTSDEYNQLTVSIGDIHTKALGIDSIDISTQSGAQSAIDTIKNAINQVSSIRGTLGATQNRLEHTANNLSVMTENIQDAESTIRDTDIAEEMMAYTKNNILVQSAQAMLAQANQIPQGVLQLLG